jgi:hypothetical protein
MITTKDWVYAGVIAALLAAFGVYTVHERHVGEHKIEAADARVVAAQIVHNTEVDHVVQTKVAAAVADYESLAPIPVAAVVPVLVCHASGSGPVLQSRGAPSAGNGKRIAVPTPAATADAGFNPAPAISADGSAADEEIEHLQKKITLLQALVQTYQGAGLVAK